MIMQTSDEKLNELLKRAAPIPANNNLAQRIILNANQNIHGYSEYGNGNAGSLFKQILNSFIIPKPAYALACSMLLGVLVGWQNSDVAGISLNLEESLTVTTIEEDLSSLFLAEVNYYE
jgi:hypothetical protein